MAPRLGPAYAGWMVKLHKIAPCLWFDDQALEAARFYVSIFDGSEIDEISRYGTEGFEYHGRPEGSVMTVAFHLGEQSFTALNGGPMFKFSEAISLQIFCDTQDEVDHFWSRLTSDGGQESNCGWLKDRFGLSWQVVPTPAIAMMQDPDKAKAARATRALFTMRKIDIAEMRRAFDGP